MTLSRIIRYVFFVLLFTSTVTVNANDIDIREWKVPYENTRPRDPFVDTHGRVWFCGQGGEYVAYLIPETGEFRKYDLGEGEGPHNLIVDKDGYVWFAANTKPYIGKLDPDSGDVTAYPTPDPGASDPHTLVFNRAGDIWFTAQRSNHIGKLIIRTGEVKLVEVPIERARPYGIKMDSRDRPWIVLFGTNKIANVDPKTMKLEIFDLPDASTRPRRLVITSDDAIWYGDYTNGKLGRFDPGSGDIREWSLPGGKNAQPYGMARDDRDTVWVVEGGLNPNMFVGFDSREEKFISQTEVPGNSVGGTIRHMYFHSPTGEIWFGEDSNYIGRARIR